MHFRLFTLSQKKTNCYPLTHHTWKMLPHYVVKCKTYSSDWRCCCCQWSVVVRQHIMLVTQSSFYAVRHTSSSSVLTWPASSPDLNPVDIASGTCCKSTCIDYQSAIWTSCGSVLLWHGLNFSSAWWTMQLISGEKDWKYVSVQKVVTLNTCCDVACLVFQLPNITTGSFQSHQCLAECNITFSQTKMFCFCILQCSAVTFFEVWWVRG